MKRLHKLICFLELVLALTVILVLIFGILDAGVIKNIPWLVVYEDIATIFALIYAFVFIISLILKNVFWYKITRQIHFQLISGWIFYIIPIASIFLPRISLLIYIRQNKKDKILVFISSTLFFLLALALLLSVPLVDFLIEQIELVSISGVIIPVLIFLILSFSHFCYYQLLKIVKIDNSEVFNEIDSIGKKAL